MKAGKLIFRALKKYTAELVAISTKDTHTLLTRGNGFLQIEVFEGASLPAIPSKLWDREELEAVNAICIPSGKPPLKRGHAGRPNTTAATGATTMAASVAGTARRKATCKYSASHVSATILPWSIPAESCNSVQPGRRSQ